MTFGADSDTICHQPTEYLGEPVEAEPYAYARPLLFLGVPLGCEKGEAGRDGCFEDAEEEAHSYRAGIILYGRHAAENEAPHYDAERGVFSQGQALE